MIIKSIIAGREAEVETEEEVMNTMIEEVMMTGEVMKIEEIMMTGEAMEIEEIMMIEEVIVIEETMMTEETMTTENIIPREEAGVKVVTDIAVLAVTMMIITMIMININLVRTGGDEIIDECVNSMSFAFCLLQTLMNL